MGVGGEMGISARGASPALADQLLQLERALRGPERSRKSVKKAASSIHIAGEKIRYILHVGLF